MPYSLLQQDAQQLTKELFSPQLPQVERLLKVFDNGGINKRQLCMPALWHKTKHSFAQRNELYIELATKYSAEVIEDCLCNSEYLSRKIEPEEIDALIFISNTGIATPSIDAKLTNILPFSKTVKRLPLWGLGCAGGAAGISRALDYCRAYPKAKVLVVCVELCSLTFQTDDVRKSNIVGASLFADGAAAVLVCGEEANVEVTCHVPYLIASKSQLLPDSEQVMGWDVQNSGLHVIFQRSIPSIITNWLHGVVHEFLDEHYMTLRDVPYFVAHPGGKKVLEAYENSLSLSTEQTAIARSILQQYGNMSSPTVLYVLEQYMLQNKTSQQYGLLIALGPGFCSEAVIMKWGA